MKETDLCAVIGGDGFIGSNLVRGLVDRGFKVRVVDRFRGNKSVNLEQIRDRIETVSADVFDQNCLDNSIVEGVKYLFHFAAPSTPSSSLLDPIAEFQIHLLPTIKLFDAAKRSGVSRVLFPSSGGTVYGPRPKCPVSEDSPVNPATPHSIVKVALEAYLGFLRLQGLDSIVYRIGNPYGPCQRGWIRQQGVISVLLRAAALDEPVRIASAGRTVRDYIFIGDVIEAILKSFDKPHVHHVYNIGSEKGRSLRAVIRLVESVTKKRIQQQKVETFRTSETTKVVLDTRRLRREFKWQPKISLSDGIRKTWEWIQTIADQELVKR